MRNRIFISGGQEKGVCPWYRLPSVFLKSGQPSHDPGDDRLQASKALTSLHALPLQPTPPP